MVLHLTALARALLRTSPSLTRPSGLRTWRPLRIPREKTESKRVGHNSERKQKGASRKKLRLSQRCHLGRKSRKKIAEGILGRKSRKDISEEILGRKSQLHQAGAAADTGATSMLSTSIISIWIHRLRSGERFLGDRDRARSTAFDASSSALCCHEDRSW